MLVEFQFSMQLDMPASMSESIMFITSLHLKQKFLPTQSMREDISDSFVKFALVGFDVKVKG